MKRQRLSIVPQHGAGCLAPGASLAAPTHGRYFFIDLVREGVVLFEEPEPELADPQPLSPAEALRETREYYEDWFESAAGFRLTADCALRNEDPELAA